MWVNFMRILLFPWLSFSKVHFTNFSFTSLPLALTSMEYCCSHFSISSLVCLEESLEYKDGLKMYTNSSLQAAKMQCYLLGDHSTQSTTLFSNLYFLRILALLTSHTIRLWSSSPDARYLPQGETEIDLTQLLWKENSTLSLIGKGFKSFGDGSSGMSTFGSWTLIFFLVSLGHMYKSRHLSKCSLTKSWYIGTLRRESNFYGKKLYGFSDSSISSNWAFSFSSNRYSSGGL